MLCIELCCVANNGRNVRASVFKIIICFTHSCPCEYPVMQTIPRDVQLLVHRYVHRNKLDAVHNEMLSSAIKVPWTEEECREFITTRLDQCKRCIELVGGVKSSCFAQLSNHSRWYSSINGICYSVTSTYNAQTHMYGKKIANPKLFCTGRQCLYAEWLDKQIYDTEFWSIAIHDLKSQVRSIGDTCCTPPGNLDQWGRFPVIGRE